MEIRDYIQLKEAAEKWNISVRRVQTLCATNRIPGVFRMGRDWMIPGDAQKPMDGRSKASHMGTDARQKVNLPMPRKTPFLYMTDLYCAPGSAEEVTKNTATNKTIKRLLSHRLMPSPPFSL